MALIPSLCETGFQVVYLKANMVNAAARFEKLQNRGARAGRFHEFYRRSVRAVGGQKGDADHLQRVVDDCAIPIETECRLKTGYAVRNRSYYVTGVMETAAVVDGHFSITSRLLSLRAVRAAIGAPEMPIHIEPFDSAHISAVRSFNARLREGGAPAEYVFFETPQPKWLPKYRADVFNELFLAVDGSADGAGEDPRAVRGAYALKRQPFLVRGEVTTVGYYHHPFSEGIVNKKYSMIGAVLLNDALRREPLTYCLGMGGYDRPLPRMLTAMKWRHFAVPFRVRVLRPFRFLRGMKTLRRNLVRALACDFAAFSGLGPVALRVLQVWKGRRTWFSGANPVTTEEPSFGDWADDLWKRCAPEYPLIAIRDKQALNVLFPADNSRFIRLRISRRDEETLGWAVLAVKNMDNHPQYGRLRVGQIVDVLARPEHAAEVMLAAVRVLGSRGADLAVCNHSHRDWVSAMDTTGFMEGPSNFIFAASPAMARTIDPFEEYAERLFFTRADGDGLYQFM